jgi:hypothetical protein
MPIRISDIWLLYSGVAAFWETGGQGCLGFLTGNNCLLNSISRKWAAILSTLKPKKKNYSFRLNQIFSLSGIIQKLFHIVNAYYYQ